MAYIPKEHEDFDILPFCRKHGYEVFSYPVKMRSKLADIGISEHLIPYGYHSYEEFDAYLDSLILKYADHHKIAEKLKDYKTEIHKMNPKEEWSVLRYLGNVIKIA